MNQSARKIPLPHQKDAVDAIVRALFQENIHNRATILMPCGTGKTLVQLWACEEANAKSILVLLPSLALVRQSLHEWIEQTKIQQLQILAVCSDDTVVSGLEDELVFTKADLDFPVTSSAAVVRSFLASSTSDVKIIFSTYHSANVVAEGMPSGFAFDIGVFDEAHKTAGKEGGIFTFALSDANLPIRKRAFFTATPRHYNIARIEEKLLKQGKEIPLVFTMDDPETYGPVVYQLSFRESVRRAIICDYEIVVSVVTSSMLGSKLLRDGRVEVLGKLVPAKDVAHCIAVAQAVEKHDVRKVFTFHPRVRDAEEFSNGGPLAIAHHLPEDFVITHVNGKMPTASRAVEMDRFREAKRALVSNARCLTEGVDVPAVDLVAFLSKKRDLIDIVQATGRAMRRAPGKTKGYILIPLYLDQTEGETLEQAVARADFREVWAVLNAMREQDDALANRISRLKIGDGEDEGRDKDDADGEDYIDVIGPTIDLQLLRESIATRVVRVLGLYQTWDEASTATQSLVRRPMNQREYRLGYKQDPRLPSNPVWCYASVWKSLGGWPGFLGTFSSHRPSLYTTWEDASAAAQMLVPRPLNRREYLDVRKQNPRLPSHPHHIYLAEFRSRGGWPGFLGTLDSKRPPRYTTWEEASAAAQLLVPRPKNQYMYRDGYKQNPRLPSNPNWCYATEWESRGGWQGFLGTLPYGTWEEASAAAQNLEPRPVRHQDYRDHYKQDPRLVSHPAYIYSSVWKERGSWSGFLGTKKDKNS